MGGYLVIDASQLRPYSTRLQQRFSAGAGATFLKTRVVPYLRRESFRTFAQSTGRVTSWPSLTESTIAEKRRLGVAQPEKPLRRTGEMMSRVWAFTGGVFPIPGGVELIYPDPREAQSIRRFIGHQLGTPFGGNNPNLPARPMIEWAPQDEAAILAAANAFFLEGLA